MLGDGALLGQAYLQHLSDDDLRLVSAANHLVMAPADAPAGLRRLPEDVVRLLARTETVEAVFGPVGDEVGLFATSPFLVFSVAISRVAGELSKVSYIEEWLGPRRRTPVFDVAPLRDFLADGWRRLFLGELLSSYTRVASGSVAVPTRRGVRRHRFSELDPVRLASLLEVVPELEHPGIYRRLGDLSLFLTGVFPDHTALHGVSSLDEVRLLRAGRLRPRAPGSTGTIPGFGDASAVELFERLGQRWYQLAYELLPKPIPATLRTVGELPTHFSQARRILNVLTDQYLFPFRSEWFGMASK